LTSPVEIFTFEKKFGNMTFTKLDGGQYGWQLYLNRDLTNLFVSFIVKIDGLKAVFSRFKSSSSTTTST
jgi:hypothetical protein